MTSQERKEIRYNNRQKNRSKTSNQDISEIYDLMNLFDSYDKQVCGKKKKKTSSIRYADKSCFRLYDVHDRSKNGIIYHSKGLYDVDVNDRGKNRHIKAPYLEERIVQKCFTDNYLNDRIYPTLAPGNLGNVKGEGTDKLLDKLCKDLAVLYKHYGLDAYILVTDFKGYYDSMLPEVGREIVYKNSENSLIMKQADEFIPSGSGLPFGSPVSQSIAIAYPNPIDHLMKEKYGIKQFGRYSDDAYYAHHSYEHLVKCFKVMQEEAKKLGLTYNMKKCGIYPISNFKFLKLRFHVSQKGKITHSVSSKKVESIKKRFDKLYIKYHAGEIDEFYIRQVVLTSFDYIERMGSRDNMESVVNHFHKLFGGDKHVLQSCTKYR